MLKFIAYEKDTRNRASENPERYSNKAIRALRKHQHEVVAIGGRLGTVDDVNIEKEQVQFNDINTVTLYVGAKRQPYYYDYIIGLKPERVIFNPGTENPEFQSQLEEAGIEALEACTLVLLSTGQY